MSDHTETYPITVADLAAYQLRQCKACDGTFVCEVTVNGAEKHCRDCREEHEALTQGGQGRTAGETRGAAWVVAGAVALAAVIVVVFVVALRIGGK